MTTVLFYSGFPWLSGRFFFNTQGGLLLWVVLSTWAFSFYVLGARIPVSFSFTFGRFFFRAFPVGSFSFAQFGCGYKSYSLHGAQISRFRYHPLVLLYLLLSGIAHSCESPSLASPLSLLSFLLGVGAVLATVLPLVAG
jgi:hypothetical protein